MQTATQTTEEKLPGIRHVIAIASGKGGVGKSTVTANLAVALKSLGASVGIVDADILGPSIPVMLGLEGGPRPEVNPEGQAIPPEGHGLKCMSMGMLTGNDAPAILRGPMVTKYLQMFIGGVDWGKLDYLLLDLPPGTGDVQLTLAQSVPLSGAIIVTTPQDVSLNIARRGLRMFQKVQVPILGVIENMSGFVCSHCGEHTDVFKSGGGQSMSRSLEVPFLGAIPLSEEVVESSDAGVPMLMKYPESRTAHAYSGVAESLHAQLNATPQHAVPQFIWHWEKDSSKPPWQEGTAKAPPLMPTGYRAKDTRTLEVRWGDGHVDAFDVRDLRLICRCALCVDEVTGKKLLDESKVPADVKPVTLSSVGNYALSIAFSDGHSSGIYSFDHLRNWGAAGQSQVQVNV